MDDKLKLTKADTRATWHAIDDMTYMHYGMKSDPPLPQEILDAHREKLTAAKRALRKVNAIRKQQSAAASIGRTK